MTRPLPNTTNTWPQNRAMRREPWALKHVSRRRSGKTVQPVTASKMFLRLIPVMQIFALRMLHATSARYISAHRARKQLEKLMTEAQEKNSRIYLKPTLIKKENGAHQLQSLTR